MNNVRILLLRADEPDYSRTSRERLQARGHTVAAATSGQAADHSARTDPHLALIDLRMKSAPARLPYGWRAASTSRWST